MNDPQAPSPRARLQALLAIPERQRTDAEWDELNELEIMLASGNRQGAPDPNRNNPAVAGHHHGRPGGGQRHGGKPGGGGQRHGGKPGGGKFHPRPPKRGPR